MTVVFKHLKTFYRAGYKNISFMYLKKGTTSHPIYNRLCQPLIFGTEEGDMEKLIIDTKNILSKLQRVTKDAGQTKTAGDDDIADATNKTVNKFKSSDEDGREQVVEQAPAVQKQTGKKKGVDKEGVDHNGEDEDDDEDDDDEEDDENDDDEDDDEDDDDEDDDDEDDDDEDDDDEDNDEDDKDNEDKNVKDS